ncbi:Hypothetical predicted protein [Olea europaea subsp. europaea]|nr:Hypothetical predicted protein [Olea europaea subsp. europaea]
MMTTVGTKGDNQSAEITQIDTKSQESSNSISKDEWLISVEKYVHDTTNKPQIQRVPSLLRDIQSNEKCYDPLVVSIGPYHHGKKQLESFENLKIPAAQNFNLACDIKVSFKQLYEEVANVGESARKCYKKGSTEKYDDESFNKMMFLDACFVLQIILSETGSNQTEEDLLRPWCNHLVFARRDLFLLENQIPLLVLKVLIKFRFKNGSDGTKLIQNFLDQTATRMSRQKKEKWEIDMDAPHLLHLFRDQLIGSSPEDINKLIGSSPEDKNENKCFKRLLHLLRERLIGSSPEDKNKLIGSTREDKNEKKCFKRLLHLLRGRFIGSSPEDKNKLIGPSPEEKNEKKCFKRLLHLLWEWLIGSSSEDKNEEKFVEWYSYRSVTELESAGIHFRPSQTNHFTDAKFKSHLLSGTLTLAPIVVEDPTKSLLLNLAAYEMCPYGPSDSLIMSYICLMDSFIDHADDVKELRKRGILVNNLGSDEELARLFNEISNNLLYDINAYKNLKMQIEKHCHSKAQVWMAEWIHDHFSSPWAFLAFLGAIFIIALTMVQTYFTVFPHSSLGH